MKNTDHWGLLEQTLLGRRQEWILARSPARHSKMIATVSTSYGFDGTSTKLKRKYDTETPLMTFGGSICDIQLAIIGLCLRTDELLLICNLVSLGALNELGVSGNVGLIHAYQCYCRPIKGSSGKTQESAR